MIGRFSVIYIRGNMLDPYVVEGQSWGKYPFKTSKIIIMFVSKFINVASTMLLELIVNVESSRIDRQKEAVDDKGSKC